MGNCRSDSSAAQSKQNGNRKVTLALFGLDNAGKTVTAKGFLGEEVETPTPTIGFSSIDFRHGRHDVTMFDLGGGRNIRGIWKNYFAEIHGAIYVVDASAPTRLDECRKTLAEVLRDEMIQGKPLLILANKQDVSGAMDEMDICDRLQLEDLVNVYRTPCRVESCSAALRKNQKMDSSIEEGFSWLLELVDEKWNDLNERVKRDVDRKEARERQEKADRAERVRKSRELREKEQKANGDVNEGEKEERDAGNPFKPIKHQLETSQKKEMEEKRNRVQQETRHHDAGRHVSSESHPESKRTASVSWKPTTKGRVSSDQYDEGPSVRSNRRSDSEEDTTRSNRQLDLDYDEVDQLRPSPRPSTAALQRERSFRLSKNRSDEENDDLKPKSTSNRRTTDPDEERMEARRRTRNWNEPLKPISPTRITGLRSGSTGSTASITDDDRDRHISIYPSRTLKTRILTPPVPLHRAVDAEGHRKWNGHSSAGNMAISNDKKKKKARNNQTEPVLDSPEPHSSWRNVYSASTHDDLFHSSSAYPPRGQERMMRTPLLQRLAEANAASNANRRKKSSDEDDDDDEEDRRRTNNARDSYSNRRPTNSVPVTTRKPNSYDYNYNDVSEDDDDDDIVV